jgi:hypothetical protein
MGWNSNWYINGDGGNSIVIDGGTLELAGGPTEINLAAAASTITVTPTTPPVIAISGGSGTISMTGGNGSLDLGDDC